MKRNLIKAFALLFYAAIIIVGCSKDENPVKSETSRNFNPKSNGGISEFRDLLNEFYGLDGYSVVERPVIVKEDEGDYYAYKVTINADSQKEGYILETPKDGNFYYEHDIANKTITTHFNDSAGKLNMSLNDMSGNEYYNHYGFTPVKPVNPVVPMWKFFGWEISFGRCGPCSNGPCAGVFATHYAFGIPGAAHQLLTRPGGNQQTVPCSDPPGSMPIGNTGDYEGNIII